MDKINTISRTVTIASNVGEVELSVGYQMVLEIHVTPVGSPSACNASLVRVVDGEEAELIASEAVSTTTVHTLYDQRVDSGILMMTDDAPLKVNFDAGTNDDQYTVTVIALW